MNKTSNKVQARERLGGYNVYLIFPYEHEGRKYVEAYPVQHEIRELLTVAPTYRLLTTKKSRNQARKYAYKLWIHPTGKGYRKQPISPSQYIPFKEHWE